ncbi:MAG: lysine exporter LysO family protein [Bacteroides sp.]|nr:lysine exporter LysO family protein [Bacteroides sp.]MCM1390762.1 lysine exporter LysO family protein [Bacteroides sp.]
MFTAILWTLFISGIVIGRIFRKNRGVRLAGSWTMPTVLLLLFLFGAEIGSDERIMLSLPQLGAKAATMAVACVAGSVFLSGLVYRIVKNRIKQ